MNIAQARDALSCEDFLASVGHKPASSQHNGKTLWYRSPLRNGDSDPSFKIDRELRTWYDFGLAEGGHVVKLVAEFYRESLQDALARIRTSSHSVPSNHFRPIPPKIAQNVSQGYSEATERKVNQIEKVCDISHPALLQYLTDERKIASSVFLAQENLKQVHFVTPSGHKVFALGWKSKNGGFEIRNKSFKGFIGEHKTITHLPVEGVKSVLVFSGFMNYLSLVQEVHSDAFFPSVLTLNGDKLTQEALSEIVEYGYEEVVLFSDNDASGQRVVSEFQEGCSKHEIRLIDRSKGYKKYNDYNDKIRGIRIHGKS